MERDAGLGAAMAESLQNDKAKGFEFILLSIIDVMPDHDRERLPLSVKNWWMDRAKRPSFEWYK